MNMRTLLLASIVATVSAFGLKLPPFCNLAGSLFMNTSPGSSSISITDCPPNSSNCIRTTWTAPPGTNVAKSVQSILDSYPQEGQNKIDKGGWSIAEGDLVKSGRVRVEFKSGLGIFAKLVNGNKPFIDDLTIVLTRNTVELKSASRIGQSDLGVNRKRLLFLATKAEAMGFDAPEPKYR